MVTNNSPFCNVTRNPYVRYLWKTSIIKVCMKTTPLIIILSFQVLAGFCQNLISNSDFENNGQLICDSWYDRCGKELTYICDTNSSEPLCDVLFYQDAPPDDGNWSIGLTGVGNSFPATATTFITGLDFIGNFQLNAWMKDIGNAFGGIEVGVLSEGQYTSAIMIQADSGDWKYYTNDIALTIDPSDSVQVRLWAFAGGPLFGVINFDLVELILLDSLNSINQYANIEMRTYPNPCNDYFMIEMNDQPIDEYIISVFNSGGLPVKTFHTNQPITRVDFKNEANGLYFYQVKRKRDQSVMGFGKVCMGKE